MERKARLEGRVALITGASRGIGAAIAEAYAAEGARVALVARKPEALHALAEAINARHGPVAMARPMHVGQIEGVPAMLAEVEERFGPVAVLVNNAGTNPEFGPMLGASAAAFDKTFEVNVRGPLALSQAVAQRLLDLDRPGSILNVSSVFGLRAAPFQGIYGMTKAAIISMTRTLAVELGGGKIRVNCIAPGLVDTKLAAAIVQSPELSRIFEERSAMRRYAQPAEIAGIAVFLASEEASYVTGQVYAVDGGYTAT